MATAPNGVVNTTTSTLSVEALERIFPLLLEFLKGPSVVKNLCGIRLESWDRNGDFIVDVYIRGKLVAVFIDEVLTNPY